MAILRPKIGLGLGLGGRVGFADIPAIATHVWDSQHLSIIGSTTTALDFNVVGVKHDMANPAASNQPTFIASDAGFNNLPVLNFSVDDYLYKSVSDFLLTEISGEIHIVVNPVLGKAIQGFTSSDESSADVLLGVCGNNGTHYGRVKTAGFDNGIRDNIPTSMTSLPTSLISVASSGTSYRIWLDGVESTLSMHFGLNDGKWFSSVPGRDNISIGGQITATPFYGFFKWAYTGLYPYLSDSDRNVEMARLKTKYGIL